MNEIPQLLADAITDSAKTDWHKAKLEIKVFGGSVDTCLEFYGADGNSHYAFLTDHEKISRPVYTLHQSMNAENPKHWNTLVFEIGSNGKFTMNLEWDQALQDEFEENSSL